MSLALLPKKHVEAVFNSIRPAKYVEETKVKCRVWTLTDWSVCNMAVGINIDVEG